MSPLEWVKSTADSPGYFHRFLHPDESIPKSIICNSHDPVFNLSALQKASRIRSRINSTVYVLDQGIKARLQASFGVASFPQHATDSNGLIAAADHALFAIKKTGRNAIGRYQNRQKVHFYPKQRKSMDGKLAAVPDCPPHDSGRPATNN